MTPLVRVRDNPERACLHSCPTPRSSIAPAAWNADEAARRELDKQVWVASEKLHVTHLCICTDGVQIVAAKRRAVLDATELFFAYKRALAPLVPRVRRLFASSATWRGPSSMASCSVAGTRTPAWPRSVACSPCRRRLRRGRHRAGVRARAQAARVAIVRAWPGGQRRRYGSVRHRKPRSESCCRSLVVDCCPKLNPHALGRVAWRRFLVATWAFL